MNDNMLIQIIIKLKIDIIINFFIANFVKKITK